MPRVGVGKYEDPRTPVRRPHLLSADNAGTGGVSESLEVSEDETKSPGPVSHDVLTDDVARPEGVNDAGHGRPEPALVIGSASLAGG